MIGNCLLAQFHSSANLVPSGRYREAFVACRKHRIDLNTLVDHNPVGFMANIRIFVDQLDDVDHINLFLSGIG